MQRRAAMINAKLNLESEPLKGATLTLKIEGVNKMLLCFFIILNHSNSVDRSIPKPASTGKAL
jgi:hypothetical protein